MSALAGGVDQHRTGAVDHIAGSDLFVAGLEHVFEFTASAGADLLDNGEDRTDRNVHIDIGRAVEWVEQETIFTALEPFGDLDDIRLFFGCHSAEPAAVIDSFNDDIVRDDVQLLLDFALDILVGSSPDDVDESGASHLIGDNLSSDGEVVQQS